MFECVILKITSINFFYCFQWSHASVSASWRCPFSSFVIMHKVNNGLFAFLFDIFIMVLPLLTLHCYDVTLWQAWCFLELLWTWFLNLLPCLSSKFGTHFFNLAVLLWNLQRFGIEVDSSLHMAEVKKAYYSYDCY